MKIYHIPASAPMYTNTFVLIGENKKAAVIDAAAPIDLYLEVLKKENAELTHILLTHGHFDHVGTAEALRELTGARVYLNKEDTAGDRMFPFTSPDEGYTDGETICVDTDVQLTVIATPGHSEGSVCLLAEDALFSGDTLFANAVGRTDFEGGSMEKLCKSLRKLCDTVTENVRVLPGHEGFTMMNEEKARNPYLRFGGE